MSERMTIEQKLIQECDELRSELEKCRQQNTENLANVSRREWQAQCELKELRAELEREIKTSFEKSKVILELEQKLRDLRIELAAMKVPSRAPEDCEDELRQKYNDLCLELAMVRAQIATQTNTQMDLNKTSRQQAAYRRYEAIYNLYQSGKTFPEIGKELHLSVSRVREMYLKWEHIQKQGTGGVHE